MLHWLGQLRPHQSVQILKTTTLLSTSAIFLRFLCCSAVLSAIPAVAELPLSKEGRRLQAAHGHLFEALVPVGDAEFAGKAEGPRGRVLKRLTVARPGVTVDGTVELALPAGLAPVLQFFRYIELRGKDLGGIDGRLELLPAAAGAGMHRSGRGATFLRVQIPSIPTSSATEDAVFRIRIKGTGTVERIDILPFGGGLSERFDPLPYQNLGYDRPPRAEALALDLTRTLSHGGVTGVDRRQWFRIYAKPMSLPGVLAREVAGYGFSPGRQILKISPALEKYPPVKLGEDPARPGWHDPEYFTQKYQNTTYKKIGERWAGLPFAMCFDDWPQFMCVGSSPADNGRGTPREDAFDAAATLAADILENQIKHSGRTATWWEVKNESSIKAEWDYHWRGKEIDSWGILSTFHNKVAGAVHARTPGVKVGGPASAWMQVQVGDFILWRKQVQFMDETRGHLDFYSHHFYESPGTVGAYTRRTSGYTNYLHGRMTSILDMVRAHMHGTDNVHPVLITEMGALNVGRTQADYWLRLRAMSGFLTQLMDRPDEVALAVPFLFANVPWNPGSGYAAFVPKPGKSPNSKDLADYVATPNLHFFQLWKDFAGTYLPVTTASRTTFAVAAYEEGRVHIAVTNVSPDRIALNLGDLPEGAKLEQRRLRYYDGEIRYQDPAPADPAAVPVDVEETTLLTLHLPAVLRPDKTLLRTSAYAPETAVPLTDAPKDGFSIATPEPATLTRVRLAVGLHRSGGIRGPLEVIVNGYPYQADISSWAQNVSDLFEPAILEIDPAHLREENLIRVSIASGEPKITLTSLHFDLDREG